MEQIKDWRIWDMSYPHYENVYVDCYSITYAQAIEEAEEWLVDMYQDALSPTDDALFVPVEIHELYDISEENSEEVEEETEHYSSFTIVVNPPAPEGTTETSWRSPYSVLGGLKENPGVQGYGGGVIVEEVCSNTGWYRVTNSWAQDPVNGKQGYTTVTYREPDSASLEWLEELEVN